MLTEEHIILLNDRNLQVGNICRQWSNIEYLVALAIWQMLRVDAETGAILTGGLSMSARITLAIKLAKHLEAPAKVTESLKKLKESINSGIDESRNQAVHGNRLLNPNKPDTDLVIMHKGIHKGVFPQSNEDLAKLGKEIANLGKVFYEELLSTGIYEWPVSKPANIIAEKTSDNLSLKSSYSSS